MAVRLFFTKKVSDGFAEISLCTATLRNEVQIQLNVSDTKLTSSGTDLVAPRSAVEC